MREKYQIKGGGGREQKNNNALLPTHRERRRPVLHDQETRAASNQRGPFAQCMPDLEQRGEDLMETCAYERGAGGTATVGYQARAAAAPAAAGTGTGTGSCPCEYNHHRPTLSASDSPPALVVLLEYIHARASGSPAALVALLEAAAGSDKLLPVAIGASKGQQPSRNYLSLPAARGAAGGVPPEFLLPLAVKHNYLDCVRELLRLGANVEAVDEIGLTPLLVATRAGNVSAIDILVDLVRRTFEFLKLKWECGLLVGWEGCGLLVSFLASS